MKKSVMSTILAAAMAIGAMPGTVFAGEAAKLYEGVTLSMWIGNSEYNDGTKAVLEKATEELGMEFNIEISQYLQKKLERDLVVELHMIKLLI